MENEDYDKKIDELLEIDEASKPTLTLLTELRALRNRLKTVQQTAKKVDTSISDRVDFCIKNLGDYADDEEYLRLTQELDNLEYEENELYDLIAEKQKEYEQSEKAFKKFAQAKGEEYYDSQYFADVNKKNFLNELFANINIDYVTEDTRAFFDKLVKLYGEDFLANYTYTIYEQDVEHDQLVTYEVDTLTIQDFVRGQEDNLLDLVTSDALRNAILGKKMEITPLQQREEELSSLEAEEKTIAETEALIEKQTAKEGQDIGEN